MYTLVLIRHGESVWNLENRFTGWTDVDLTPKGVEQARHAGTLLKDAGFAVSEEALLAGIDSLEINSDGRFIYEEMRKWWFSGHRVR